MTTRKRGGNKDKPKKNDAFKTSNNPNRINFNPEVTHIIHRNPYYSKKGMPNTITTELSDKEFVKRYNAAEAYYNLDKKMRPGLPDKTIKGQTFSKKKFRKVINLMMTPKFVEIKTKLRERGFPEVTNEEFRKIAKRFCKTNDNENLVEGEGSALKSVDDDSHGIVTKSLRFTEKQQREIFDIIDEEVTPIVKDESTDKSTNGSNDSFCAIMGGTKKRNRRTKKKPKRRKTNR